MYMILDTYDMFFMIETFVPTTILSIDAEVRPNSEAGNVGSSPSPDVDVMALDHIQMPIDAPTRALLRHQLLEVLQTSSRYVSAVLMPCVA